MIEQVLPTADDRYRELRWLCVDKFLKTVPYWIEHPDEWLDLMRFTLKDLDRLDPIDFEIDVDELNE